MSDKDIQLLMDLARKQSQEKLTPEEALCLFVRAGILDENGNLTPPYVDLAVPPRK
jgi:hypothetical protein